MSWSHRVILHKSENGNYLGIHEVFVDDNGKVFATTVEPEKVYVDEDEGVDALRIYLGWMLECLNKPILDYDCIPEDGAINAFENVDKEGLSEWV